MAGFIPQDERLRFDSAGANDGRLEAISGLRTHQNDGYAGEQEQGVHQSPVAIRSFKFLHPRGQKVEVSLRGIHFTPPENSMGESC